LYNLIRNENMKLYSRWRTWIMMGLMIGAVLLGSFVDWYYDDKTEPPDAWREQVMAERNSVAELVEDPNFDEAAREQFREQLAMLDYRLEHNIRLSAGTMWDGIYGSAQLVVLITLFTVIVAGDSLAGEFTTGTIKLLLIRPASRTKILLSKYLSMILFGLVLLFILFIVSVLVSGLLYRFEHMGLPMLSVDAQGHIVEKSMFANLWQTYLLKGVSTVMFVTMAFMISSAFRSSTMAIGFSIFALFAGTILIELVRSYAWSKYLLFANIDLSQYLEGRPYQEGMTLSFSVTMLIAYFLVFNLIAWLVFTRRDVAA
jgi:ABC-2 type transport system permease protein